jgi:hypothetical protein
MSRLKDQMSFTIAAVKSQIIININKVHNVMAKE